MNLSSTDFELFELAPRFQVERATLDARWRVLQAQVHPDKFALESAAAQRVAMQWAVRVNEAYERLKNPLQRAAYLCELHGAPIKAESNTAMPTAFLMQQMEWREALDEATSEPALATLAAQVAQEQRQLLEQLQTLLDVRHDFANATQQVRALMFIERFALDLGQRLDALTT
jgi:molecular chaperone HscB